MTTVQGESTVADSERGKGNVKMRKLPLIIVTALLSSSLTLAGSWIIFSSSINAASLAAKTSGKVALTAAELRSVVQDLGETIFWSGPMQGAKYTLDRTDHGQVFVRYLPGGVGDTDPTPKYRVIATYQESGAFEAMKTSGKQTNGVTFTNTDGAQVYYDKTIPTNVYVAYKGLRFQIEIFDPIPGTALRLATTSGRLRTI